MPARLVPTEVSGVARLASDPGAPDSQSVTVGGPSAAAAAPAVGPSTRPSAAAPTTIDRRDTCGRFFIARVFYPGAGADHNWVVAGAPGGSLTAPSSARGRCS